MLIVILSRVTFLISPRFLTQARDCWAVAFGDAHSDTERCVAAGYDNGDVKLFDLRTNRPRWAANLGNGVCGLQFDRRDIAMNKLVATCLEGQCHVFDMRTQHPTEARPLLPPLGPLNACGSPGGRMHDWHKYCEIMPVGHVPLRPCSCERHVMRRIINPHAVAPALPQPSRPWRTART